MRELNFQSLRPNGTIIACFTNDNNLINSMDPISLHPLYLSASGGLVTRMNDFATVRKQWNIWVVIFRKDFLLMDFCR